jgi:hypothetical protein
MQLLDNQVRIQQERQRDWLNDAMQVQRAKDAFIHRPGVARTMAKVLGNSLMWLGARVLRYGEPNRRGSASTRLTSN